LRARLTAIINNATQHAEVIIARGQPQVFIGAFPQPSDLTVTRTQQIDIDDILAVEAGAPGNGVAFAIHEIEENFQAHGVAALAGTDRFADAHRLAETNAENPVASELVGPGRRVAFVQVPGTIVPTIAFRIMGMPVSIPGSVSPVANTTAMFFDYENYYLGVTSSFVAATQDSPIVNSRRFPKTVLSTATIDNFASGSNIVPPAGAAAIAAAAALVAANPIATVNVQGFSDNVGSAAANITASQNKANSVTTALQAAGVLRLSMNSEGLGATNFVAPNVTAADRARNRRVIITVTIPQL
jgi:outer membrane protein OmpA-like peptidoglycan-associated protein